ncbi:MAG: Ppx/GppA family phosphatase [Solirubrobacteraceae bacterium]|nr:Ppx/GppA family phosphatase [Solirubrobacteraceae bacterium]
MRVGIVDIGTNSTRLLIADVDGQERVTELVRRSIVTRLGEGVDGTGRLGDAPMARVFAVLDQYRRLMDEHGVSATFAVLTSATRDAANGAEFTATIRERYGLDAHTIDGDTEANLTFTGATSERPHDGEEIVVIDIGGGSTEFVVGRDGQVDFHVSTQVGVVRQGERFLRHDPPAHDEMVAMADEVREVFRTAVPDQLRAKTTRAIAVAGTATQSAAIDLELEPYEAARVHGHVLELATLDLLLARLAQMPLAERVDVVGLDPDRAPTIVAGVAMLVEALRAYGLERVEVSEHDILRGAALALSRGGVR